MTVHNVDFNISAGIKTSPLTRAGSFFLYCVLKHVHVYELSLALRYGAMSLVVLYIRFPCWIINLIKVLMDLFRYSVLQTLLKLSCFLTNFLRKVYVYVDVSVWFTILHLHYMRVRGYLIDILCWYHWNFHWVFLIFFINSKI